MHSCVIILMWWVYRSRCKQILYSYLLCTFTHIKQSPLILLNCPWDFSHITLAYVCYEQLYQMQPKKNQSADCTTNQWYLLEFQKDLTLLSFHYASVPEQQAYLTCQTLWPSLGQQFGCGRAQPAADRQAWCLKSKGRAAAQQTGSLLWMTAIHFPLEHHGHMSAASYSAQCSTVSQCVFWYSSAWQGGVGGGGVGSDNLSYDLEDRDHPLETKSLCTQEISDLTVESWRNKSSYFWFSPWKKVVPCHLASSK